MVAGAVSGKIGVTRDRLYCLLKNYTYGGRSRHAVKFTKENSPITNFNR